MALNLRQSRYRIHKVQKSNFYAKMLNSIIIDSKTFRIGVQHEWFRSDTSFHNNIF